MKIFRAFLLLPQVFLLCGWQSAQEDLGDQVRQAEEALKSGDYAAAITRYQELIEKLPLSGLKMNLGIAFYQAGQFREAVEVLEDVQVEPGSETELRLTWLYLGDSYLQLGQPEKAVAPLEKYLGLEADSREGRRMLVDALRATGRLEAVAHQCRILAKQDPKDPQVLYDLGRNYEALSGKSFARLEELAPESSYWFALIGDLRLTQQQYSTAFFFYRKALEKDPKMRGVHVAVSQIYRVREHPEWAETELRKEMALGMPDCDSEPMVCAFLSQDYLKLAELATRKETPETLYWRVQAYNQLALGSFSKLAQLPPSAALHKLKAEINRDRGDHKSSADEWAQVVRLSPEDHEARQEWAFSLVLSRDFETARPIVEGMLKSDPESALLLFMAGEIRLGQQHPDEGIPFLVKSLELDPDFLATHASLGRAYLDLSEPAKAVKHLEKALVLDTDGSIHYQLGRAYMGAGQREQSRDMMLKYQEIRKTDLAETEQVLEETQITPP